LFDIIKILYRELHYQMVKSNPMVANDERQFQREVKKAMDIKRNIGTQSAIFLFFGIMTAGSVFAADSEAMMIGVLTSLALIPLVLSIYQTTIQASYLTSLGIFDPLKPLPVDLGGKYMSGVIAIDLIPSFVLVFPSVVALMIRSPISGAIALVWMLIGVMAGHVVGLGVFAIFGQKVTTYKGSLSFVKNILKIIGLLLFMGLFFGVMYLQEYIVDYVGVIGEYSIVYPISLATVFQPMTSIVLIGLHLLILIPIYVMSLKKVWSGILEPDIVSSGEVEKVYKTSVRPPIVSLLTKDLKIVFRKTSMMAGMLLPLYIVLPQLLIGLTEGLVMGQFMIMIFSVGLLTVAGGDAIFKIEGNSIQFLRTLPVDKQQFAISKAFSMIVIPVIISVCLIGIGVYFTMEALYLLPLSIVLPLTASIVTVAFLFRYKGNNIGVPEFDFKKMFLLFFIVGVVFLLIGLPILILGDLGFLVSPMIALAITFMLYTTLEN